MRRRLTALLATVVMMVMVVMVVAAGLALAAAAPAWAQPPVTDTNVERLTESFTEPFLCQDEPYQITANLHIVEHFTAAGIDEEGNFILPLHYQFKIHGNVVAVPSTERVLRSPRILGPAIRRTSET